MQRICGVHMDMSMATTYGIPLAALIRVKAATQKITPQSKSPKTLSDMHLILFIFTPIVILLTLENEVAYQ